MIALRILPLAGGKTAVEEEEEVGEAEVSTGDLKELSEVTFFGVAVLDCISPLLAAEGEANDWYKLLSRIRLYLSASHFRCAEEREDDDMMNDDDGDNNGAPS